MTSLFFAAIHLHLSDWPHIRGWEAFPPLAALSVVLGYNYERTGRLLPNIVIHGLFNVLNLVPLLIS